MLIWSKQVDQYFYDIVFSDLGLTEHSGGAIFYFVLSRYLYSVEHKIENGATAIVDVMHSSNLKQLIRAIKRRRPGYCYPNDLEMAELALKGFTD